MTPDPAPSDRLITYEEIAPLLNVSVSTVRRWVDQKMIPCIQMGHQVVRFHYPTVLEHLQRTGTRARISSETDESTS